MNNGGRTQPAPQQADVHVLRPQRPATCAVTHSHTDHVSGVPSLLAAYPKAHVVVHEKEVPFLNGQAKHLPSPGAFWRVLRALGLINELITVRNTWLLTTQPGVRSFKPACRGHRRHAPAGPTPPHPLLHLSVQVPRHRLRLLRDSDTPDGAPSSITLREAGVQSLAFIPTPGHSPGHVSYLHEPTGAVLGGDVLLRLWPRIKLGPQHRWPSPAPKPLSYEYPVTWLIVQI